MGLREDINQIKPAQPKFPVNFVIASVRFAKGNQALDSVSAKELVNLVLLQQRASNTWRKSNCGGI